MKARRKTYAYTHPSDRAAARPLEGGPAILADDLGMEPDEAGVEIRCRQGDALEVTCDGASVDIT